ncbi:SMI1/KNR4 family protein [uncultured Halopseudomonas sp.]|uniref:SMI1/KNR4 family protein n=1 Tax=uncultured Halopseudomonas sp. TaxID=2901193 RepID=UPI0030ECD093|tara:strand:+ start:884 stop:1369 length:486 start_codon:yes stop_codon:yes gene_type:complete
MSIQSLIDRSNQQGDEVWISGGASELAIIVIEQAIGAKLPSSYRNFLKEFGAIYAMDAGISGIVEDDPLAMSSGGIYADTMFMRDEFKDQYVVPDYLWVLKKHEDGAFCFNINIPTIGDEYAIVNYEPHLPESTHSEVLAATFSEYMQEWFFGYLGYDAQS